MTKKESQNGSTMGISRYNIKKEVSKTRMEWDPKTLTRSEASRMIDGLLKG